MKLFSQGWSRDVDGPGNRMIFYCQGCNFRCRYCGNPESMNRNGNLLFYPERNGRIAVEQCCPNGAILTGTDGNPCLNRETCQNCSSRFCTEVCHHPSFEYVGKDVPAEEIAQQIIRSVNLSDGVTFGGGEATLQMDELLWIADTVRRQKIDVCVESNASTPHFLQLINRIDRIICDFKCDTTQRHQFLTGRDNHIVKQQLSVAAKSFEHMLIHVPLIMGINTDQEELEKMGKFLATLHHPVEILAMHHWGEAKYRALDLEYPMQSSPLPGEAEKHLAQDIFRSFGIEIYEKNKWFLKKNPFP